MGRVYLAEDTRLGRKIALKTLSPEYVNDQDALRRFEQEARAASALNHPNIVTIHDIGQFEGIHFIACEFIEGATVRDKLRAGPVDPHSAIDIAAQVAAGLSAAHALGITHRDIKPENIIVREDGLVKVVDFGIAKLTETSMARGRRAAAQGSVAYTTDPGRVIGTAKYMSPEQARGGPIDGRSDIFSLGAVLYEMTAGRAPFEGETAGDLIAEILKTDPPALHQVAPGAPALLSGIVAKATRKDRGERYETAGQFAAELHRLQRELDFRSRAGEPIAPGRRRLKWLAAVPMVLAAIATIAIVVHWRSRALAPARPRSLAIFGLALSQAWSGFVLFAAVDDNANALAIWTVPLQ